MNVEKEQELRDLYYDPVNGYRSREKLYQKAREKGLKVSRREVKEWLETRDTYTRYKSIVRKHKFQKTYVKQLADQIQLDLVDMGKHSHETNRRKQNQPGSSLGHTQDLPLPKFKVGDTVRVSKYKSIFSKGYEANFTEEIFKVKKVLRGDPNMYEIKDHEGEPIIGKFYEEELSRVDKQDDVYRVEKILKRKKGMALVKWLGYDSKHNSWIPEKDIKNIE